MPPEHADDTTDEELALFLACLPERPADLSDLYAGNLQLSGARVLADGSVGG